MTAALRVLHVVSSLDPRDGGTATAVADMAMAQSRAGIDVRVAATMRKDADHTLVEALRKEGLSIVTIAPALSPMAWHPNILPTLRRWISDSDLAHIHALWEAIQWQAGKVSRASKIPYVLSPHGMLDPWSMSQKRWKKDTYYRLALRRVIDGATAVHCTTRAEARLAAPLLRGRPVLVQPLSLDPVPYRRSDREEDDLGLDRSQTRRRKILFLSRLHHKKGLEILFPAFARLRARDPDLLLVVAGDGARDYRRRLEEKVRALDLESDVVFTGPLRGARKVAAFHAADLFVLPSHQENFGIVVLEALASGCPAVISDQVNLAEDLGPCEAVGIAANNVESLCEAMERMLTDAALAQRTRSSGPEFVARHYAPEVAGRKWVEHYRGLLTERAVA